MIAHELAHIKNRDTLTMTITATIAGAISMLAQFGLFFGGHRDNNQGLGMIGTIAMVILAPIAAMLVQMAISRTREYAADELGARISGPPRCARLGARQDRQRRAADREPDAPSAIRRPRISSSSIRCTHHGIDNLFSTHPSTENRIAALEQLARADGTGRLWPRRPAAPAYPEDSRPPARGAGGPGAAQGPWG